MLAIGSFRWVYRRLCHLESSLESVNKAVVPLSPGLDRHVDNCLAQQLEQQVGHFQAERSDISQGILSLDQDEQRLFNQESALGKALFHLSLRIEWLLSNKVRYPLMCGIRSGINLPKINAPTFDGNVLSWNSSGNCSMWQYIVRPSWMMPKNCHILRIGSRTVQRGMSTKFWCEMRNTKTKLLAAFKVVLIDHIWYIRCMSMQFMRPRPWGTATAMCYVACMVWPLYT